MMIFPAHLRAYYRLYGVVCVSNQPKNKQSYNKDGRLLRCCVLQSPRNLTTFKRYYSIITTPTALMMDAVSTSETSVTSYQTTRRNTRDERNIYIRRHDNLKSRNISYYSWKYLISNSLNLKDMEHSSCNVFRL
jgi:hypothetical protein